MNILFMSLENITSLNQKGIYTDLLREFVKHNHKVVILSPVESKKDNNIIKEEINYKIINVVTGKIQKTNIFRKGINTILIGKKFISVIKRYLSKEKFDLILYTTPPITLVGVVDFIKRRDRAKTYLLLKDIFPQNAVDIEMMNKHGLIYKYFRRKEKRLYSISDNIGCMSPANIKYLIDKNSWLDIKKIEICPNSIEPINLKITLNNKLQVRKKYGFPLEKKIFIYGGNLGRPQDVPFITKCLEICKEIDCFFVIVGNGTDRYYLEEYIEKNKPQNVKLLNFLHKNEYDTMIGCCDVGLIFLDHRFTIPNFPSRLLSYMQSELPVIACTDKYTDIGSIIENNKFGKWCESNSADNFKRAVEEILKINLTEYGKNGYEYLKENYSAKNAFEIIENKMK